MLARRERLTRAGAERRDDAGELMGDEVTPDHLVVEIPLGEHLAVEEVAEGAVPDVVQQAGETQRLLDQRG